MKAEIGKVYLFNDSGNKYLARVSEIEAHHYTSDYYLEYNSKDDSDTMNPNNTNFNYMHYVCNTPSKEERIAFLEREQEHHQKKGIVPHADYLELHNKSGFKVGDLVRYLGNGNPLDISTCFIAGQILKLTRVSSTELSGVLYPATSAIQDFNANQVEPYIDTSIKRHTLTEWPERGWCKNPSLDLHTYLMNKFMDTHNYEGEMGTAWNAGRQWKIDNTSNNPEYHIDDLMDYIKSRQKPLPPRTEELVFGKYAVGDIVVSITSCTPFRVPGDMFKVLPKTTSNGKQLVKDLYYEVGTSSADKDAWRIATHREIKAFKKGITNIDNIVSEFGVPPPSIRVGDTIKVIRTSSNSGSEIGDILEVIQIDKSSVPYKCKRPDGTTTWLVKRNVELYLKPEFPREPKPELVPNTVQVGDTVRICRGDNSDYCSEMFDSIGKKVTIADMGDGGLFWADDFTWSLKDVEIVNAVAKRKSGPKFAVGDKVNIIPTSKYAYQAEGTAGVVKDLRGFTVSEWNSRTVRVRWDAGDTNSYPENDLVLVNSEVEIGDLDEMIKDSSTKIIKTKVPADMRAHPVTPDKAYKNQEIPMLNVRKPYKRKSK